MKNLRTVAYFFIVGIISFSLSCSSGKLEHEDNIVIGELSTGGRLGLRENADNSWGMTIKGAGHLSLLQTAPVQVQIYKDLRDIVWSSTGYKEVEKVDNGFTGRAVIKNGLSSFKFNDLWTIEGEVLHLERKVEVLKGVTDAGFLSAVTFTNQTREQVKYFAPGMIYGDPAHLTKAAIGGIDAGSAIWIREDRLPAPMFGIHYQDGTSVTILNPEPDGSTTKEDSWDLKVTTLVDERFNFGAIGAEEKEGGIHFGFMWPGTEGETTYLGRTYPGGQKNKWRRRYHPIKDGLVQEYQVSFRFGHDEAAFPDYYKKAWRWAWRTLKPQVNPRDIKLARRSLIDMLGERVETVNGLTGIPYFMSAVPREKPAIHRKTAMGFVGKALEAANYLMQDADRNQSPNDERHRQQAINIINSFVNVIKLSPPSGEGFMLDSGQPIMVRPQDGKMYLRSFGDDLKALLKAVKRERAQGREHPDWLNWAKSFADWLLPQQMADGGFPRGWKQTGEIADSSAQSSYTVIPYLVLLSELTSDPQYLLAAEEAGNFCWNSTQSKGLFVGGTIDNPDVIDKEAGTLSTEAYLALYYATKDKNWIEKAKMAADYAETWMYIWDIPMPIDEGNAELHWKKGVSTVGLQLISTGHSLVDAYMTFDVDEYAKLAVLTGDEHYMDVARILLHNTKGMLAVPGQNYDLNGPGWQQEHWSLGPMRGYGIHRGWLPWVSTSHLNGVFGLEEYDPELFEILSKDK